MRLAKYSIIITALIYLIIGIWCLFAPLQAASGIEILLPTPTAISDFRATYGGLLVGLGVFFILCLKETYIRLGLILQAFSLGGLILGRITGLLLDGMPKPILIYFLIAEIGGLILALFALQSLKRNRRPYLTS